MGSQTKHYLGLMEKEVERCTKSPDVEAVHDLRVSIRRAAQALRIFEDELPGGEARKLRKKIGKLRRKAAEVRDRDVTYALLRAQRVSPNDPACVYLQAQREMAAELLRKYLAEKWAQ